MAQEIQTGNRKPETWNENKKMGPARAETLVSGFQHTVSRSENGRFPASSLQFPDCCQALSNSQISKLLTKEWPNIKKELEFFGKHLTKWNLVKAITVLSDARKARFLRSRRPKYGSMNKGFTDEEVQRFFNVIDDPFYHLLFSFQAILGLRIGEAVRVNIKDINLRTHELRIFTEKSRKTDYLLMPMQLFDAVLVHIEAYEKDIAKASGYLFFSFCPGRRTGNTESHVTTDTARVAFMEFIAKAKLDEVYGYSSGDNPRPLHRLSPHSLRHYAITNFCKKNGGNVMLASKFARHTNLQTTMIYIHTQKDELYEGITRAQDNRLLEKIRKLQEKTV